MRDYSKAQKREMRRLAGIAHERELTREMSVLSDSFAAWQRSEFTVFDLEGRIHRFLTGPAKQLQLFYTARNDDFKVARAIASGVLNRDEVDPDLLVALRDSIDFAAERL